MTAAARTGLLVNTLSQRNRGRGAPPMREGMIRCALESMDELGGHLAALRAADVDTLIIDGGDGTVQAVLTALYAEPGEWRPRLAVLPGGMTNLIAGDVGLRGDYETAIARSRRGGVETELRPVMRVRHGDSVHCGMFFAAGLIERAILLCRREIHSRGLRASAAVGATVAWIMARHAINPARQDELFHPYRIDVLASGERDAAPKLLFLAATTRSLTLGAHPFWDEAGPIKATWARYPANQLIARLPGLFRGRPQNDEAYHSRAAARFELALDEPFVLDGEIYDPPAGGRIVIEHAADAEFVR